MEVETICNGLFQPFKILNIYIIQSHAVCVQIFMKYGRQRWKLRGRIEINAKQVWDSEEMVFLPLINEFLSVKVSLFFVCFLIILDVS